MDPDVVLSTLRAALDDGDLDLARETFAALDDWLIGGGFLPTDWTLLLASREV